MKSPICILLCVLFCTSCSICHVYTKSEVIRNAQKNDVKKNGNIIIVEEQRSVKLLTRDSNFQKVDVIFEFDDNGKQLKYTVAATCDSCFRKYLLKEIEKKSYKWQMLNDSTYVSKFAFHLMLHVHKAAYAYDIVKHDLTRKQYMDLIRSSSKEESIQ